MGVTDMGKIELWKSNHDAIAEIARTFPRHEAEEIIARILYGESLDSAMQTVLDREDY